jgi:hypothetical protein
VAEARVEADETRREADAYAADVLVKLEGECVKALQSIRGGLRALDERFQQDGSGADGEDAPFPDERTHAQL